MRNINSTNFSIKVIVIKERTGNKHTPKVLHETFVASALPRILRIQLTKKRHPHTRVPLNKILR